MKDFSLVNDAIRSLTPSVPSGVLSGISSGVSRIGQKAAAAVSEYSSLYAQNQLLKYDEDGDPSDVTTNDRQSIANSSIANAIREMRGIRDDYAALMLQLPRKTATVTFSTGVDSADRVIWFTCIPVGEQVRETDGLIVSIYIQIGFRIKDGVTDLVFMKGSIVADTPTLPEVIHKDNLLLMLLDAIMCPTYVVSTSLRSNFSNKCVPLLTRIRVSSAGQSDLYLMPTGTRSSEGYNVFVVGAPYRSTDNFGLCLTSAPVTFDGVPFDTIMPWLDLPSATGKLQYYGGSSSGTTFSADRSPLDFGGSQFITDLQPSVSGTIDTTITTSYEFSESYIPNQLEAIDSLITALENI